MHEESYLCSVECLVMPAASSSSLFWSLPEIWHTLRHMSSERAFPSRSVEYPEDPGGTFAGNDANRTLASIRQTASLLTVPQEDTTSAGALEQNEKEVVARAHLWGRIKPLRGSFRDIHGRRRGMRYRQKGFACKAAPGHLRIARTETC